MRQVSIKLAVVALVWLTAACQGLILISEKEEIELGRQYLPEIEEEFGGVLENYELTQYVDAVGQKLASVSDRKHLAHSFKILNTPEVNAFAVPGGFIYITRGLLIKLKNEAQLAGVLGHEAGHIAQRHSAKAISRAMIATLLLGIGAVAVGEKMDEDTASGLIMAGQILTSIILQGYSREEEMEADNLGIKYAYMTGYNPQGLSQVFSDVFIPLEKGAPKIPAVLRSHPYTKDRIKNATKVISENYPNSAQMPYFQQEFEKFTANFRQIYPAYEKYDQAREEYSKNKLVPALELMDKAIKIYDRDSSFFTLRAKIFTRMGKHKKAEEDLKKALAINEKNNTAQLAYGHLKFQQKDYKKAEKFFADVLNANPSNYEARFYLAESLYYQNRRTEAIPHYRIIVKAGNQMQIEKGSKFEYYYNKSLERLKELSR